MHNYIFARELPEEALYYLKHNKYIGKRIRTSYETKKHVLALFMVRTDYGSFQKVHYVAIFSDLKGNLLWNKEYDAFDNERDMQKVYKEARKELIKNYLSTVRSHSNKNK